MDLLEGESYVVLSKAGAFSSVKIRTIHLDGCRRSAWCVHQGKEEWTDDVLDLLTGR